MRIKYPINNSTQKHLSQEEVASCWTLFEKDKIELKQYRRDYRLFVALQLCAVRLYGRFLLNCNGVSPQITNYIALQLNLSPAFTVNTPTRKATLTEQRQNILNYLEFKKFGEKEENQFKSWIETQARKGLLPDKLISLSQQYLLDHKIILPGQTVIERMVTSTCNKTHTEIFDAIYKQLTPEIKREIAEFLEVGEDSQKSYFNQLKEYPPSAKAKSIKIFLKRYQKLEDLDLEGFQNHFLDNTFLEYLFKMAKKYNARDIKRFDQYKRYAFMICFLIESRKTLLDYLVQMHDQFMLEMCRTCRNAYEKKHRDFRKLHKKAVDAILLITDELLNLPEKKYFGRSDIFTPINESLLRQSVKDLKIFKNLEERGYSDLLQARYPNFRKYFAEFIKLPFKAQEGSEYLIQSIELLRQLDRGIIKSLPKNLSLQFIPHDLRLSVKTKEGKVNRNIWEIGLGLALRDKLRSGDIYLSQSKQHVSFWNLMVSGLKWEEMKVKSFDELGLPYQNQVKEFLTSKFDSAAKLSLKQWNKDDFATIINGKLKLKKNDKLIVNPEVATLQKIIEANLPLIRIEKLLMEVDQLTGFTQHFKPIQGHRSRPENFYKTLIAAIISQATNLGVVATSASVQGVSVDMLRQVLHSYIREETLTAASAEIVNHHHNHPLSATQGDGHISSSDAQRFKIRANSLLASHYPRYYGYYEKAIGLYTHVSNQLSVFNTKAISCGPREALYVLDGLLENNTILKIQAHTTDTHGYTEIIFALCFLLGFYFMPRIRDLKDQQLYRIEKGVSYGNIDDLLTKTVDLNIIAEQWESMVRVAISLKQHTTPAHIVVQRLTSSGPSDRLTRAFINLGRIIKTEYILRYITDSELRQTVQTQLNKGEYRHKLPRWIFFAEQGEFTTGNYEEIMNKASCLSLVSNAILMWNTIKIDKIIKNLESQGQVVSKETLSHISLLPFKHVLPNGTYFIDEE